VVGGNGEEVIKMENAEEAKDVIDAAETEVAVSQEEPEPNTEEQVQEDPLESSEDADSEKDS